MWGRAVDNQPSRHESFLNCIRADLHRHYERFGWMLLLKSVLFKRTYSPVFTLRLCQALNQSGWCKMLLPFARLAHRWATSRASIDLPWQTSIGPGFRIVHGFGLVVNAKARIGRNATVFHGVTIGQRDRIDSEVMETRFPEIGDDVFIGSYAQVIGCRVGTSSVIAPMSVVFDHVEEKTVVGGNPARFIKSLANSYVSKPWTGAERCAAKSAALMPICPVSRSRSGDIA
jgi:serine O-acetyltransferase